MKSFSSRWIIAPALALVAVVTLLYVTGQATTAAEPNSIRIEPPTVTVDQGQSVTLNVVAEAPATKLGAWDLRVTFDTGVVSWPPVGWESGCQGGISLGCNSTVSGVIGFNGLNPQGLSGTQILAGLEFLADGDPETCTDITLSVVSFVDPSSIETNPSLSNGEICINTTPTPTPVITDTPTPTPVITDTPTPTPVITGTPTPQTLTPTPIPSPTPIGALDSAQGETPPEGGTVTTDDDGDPGTTPDDPVETSVTAQTGGIITIEERTITEDSPTAFQFFGQQVEIDFEPADGSPAPSVDNPLTIVFEINWSLLGPLENEATVMIWRNGAIVPECTGAPNAEPDPCISNRASSAEGNVQITVLTSDASSWNFGVSAAAAGDVDCDGEVDLGDAIKIGLHGIGSDVNQEVGCPPIGSSGGASATATAAGVAFGVTGIALAAGFVATRRSRDEMTQ